MEKINLFGASGHAKVIIDILKSNGTEIGWLYDDCPHCENISGYEVLKTGNKEITGPLIISIGSNRIREKISKKYNIKFSKALSRYAIIASSALIGEGSVVMQGAIIQAEAKIGKHCIINTGASVDHECIIEDFAHISPHATLCGNVKIGEGSWIGAGAIIIPGVRIGKWCIIGAGSVVVRDISDYSVACGNPCRVIRKNE